MSLGPDESNIRLLPSVPDDRQIRLLRDFAKRTGATLEGMSARDQADTLEALALILPMADAEPVAEQARHAAALIRDGHRQLSRFSQMLSEL